MKSRNYLPLVGLLLLGKLTAQNLVLNPGFEEHGEIAGNNPALDNLRGNHVAHWTSPTGATPDYYNRSSEYLYTQFGGPQSHTGDGMVGISVYDGKKNYREYLQGELSHPLEEGKTYELSCWIALSSYSAFTIDQLGVYFAAEKVESKDQIIALKLIPQLLLEGTGKKELTGQWQLFHGTYTATGKEKFLVIGNFFTDKKTASNSLGGSFPYAYYYFDDLVLKEKGEPLPADTTQPVVMIDPPKDTLGIAPGKTLVAQNVYFETNKAIIHAESFPLLDEIIAAMKSQPGLKVEIDGHTDNVGDDARNLVLSRERAQAVADYFIAHGISADRISTKGFGSTRPISSDKDKNRRVEFIFSE